VNFGVTWLIRVRAQTGFQTAETLPKGVLAWSMQRDWFWLEKVLAFYRAFLKPGISSPGVRRTPGFAPPSRATRVSMPISLAEDRLSRSARVVGPRSLSFSKRFTQNHSSSPPSFCGMGLGLSGGACFAVSVSISARIFRNLRRVPLIRSTFLVPAAFTFLFSLPRVWPEIQNCNIFRS
jgi:hypothetical protein